jgi:hypothetical protein
VSDGGFVRCADEGFAQDGPHFAVVLWGDGLGEGVEDFVEFGGGAFSLHALTPQPATRFSGTRSVGDRRGGADRRPLAAHHFAGIWLIAITPGRHLGTRPLALTPSPSPVGAGRGGNPGAVARHSIEHMFSLARVGALATNRLPARSPHPLPGTQKVPGQWEPGEGERRDRCSLLNNSPWRRVTHTAGFSLRARGEGIGRATEVRLSERDVGRGVREPDRLQAGCCRWCGKNRW